MVLLVKRNNSVDNYLFIKHRHGFPIDFECPIVANGVRTYQAIKPDHRVSGVGAVCEGYTRPVAYFPDN